MPKPKKKQSIFSWLGRQVGHVKRAATTDVEKLPKVVYRDDKIEEAPHPSEPGVKLRRTVIDEVIVDPKKRIT